MLFCALAHIHHHIDIMTHSTAISNRLNLGNLVTYQCLISSCTTSDFPWPVRSSQSLLKTRFGAALLGTKHISLDLGTMSTPPIVCCKMARWGAISNAYYMAFKDMSLNDDKISDKLQKLAPTTSKCQNT